MGKHWWGTNQTHLAQSQASHRCTRAFFPDEIGGGFPSHERKRRHVSSQRRNARGETKCGILTCPRGRQGVYSHPSVSRALAPGPCGPQTHRCSSTFCKMAHELAGSRCGDSLPPFPLLRAVGGRRHPPSKIGKRLNPQGGGSAPSRSGQYSGHALDRHLPRHSCPSIFPRPRLLPHLVTVPLLLSQGVWALATRKHTPTCPFSPRQTAFSLQLGSRGAETLFHVFLYSFLTLLPEGGPHAVAPGKPDLTSCCKRDVRSAGCLRRRRTPRGRHQ